MKPHETGAVADDRTFPTRLKTKRRLLIGPRNSAGQGYRWSRAVERHLRDAAGHNFRDQVEANPFALDYRVERPTFNTDKVWAKNFERFVARNYTHVLFESNEPLFGAQKVGARSDIRTMRVAGLRVGILAHGSDVRIPSVHTAREKWAQYQHMDPVLVAKLEEIATANVKAFVDFDGPTFVSTLGLLEFVPDAIWCPVVVEAELWKTDRPLLEATVPVVAHIPSSGQKGSAWIDPILHGLADHGLIEYLRLEGVRRDDMPAHVGRCDILVEQFGIADYSTAAVEAMAGGRLVISRVADAVRERVFDRTGRDLPIIEANPETLESVILAQLDDRDAAREFAAQGPGFVAEVHDGRMSAAALAALIDIPAVSIPERAVRRGRNRWRDARAAVARTKKKRQKTMKRAAEAKKKRSSAPSRKAIE